MSINDKPQDKKDTDAEKEITEKTTQENNMVAAPDDNNDNGSTKDNTNYVINDEELKTLEKTAMRSLGRMAKSAIDTMKLYGAKAVSYLLRIGFGHCSPRIRRYALQTVSDLKKQL